MTATMLTVPVRDANATEALGARLANAGAPAGVIFLEGELGAGKTTFVRGWLRALGFDGPVRSPTYTLMESYELPRGRVLHLDLYRVRDPEEVDYLGLGDALDAQTVAFIEWPSLGRGYVPDPDLIIAIDYAPQGRVFRLDARTAAGAAWLASAR